jgi:outer membrane protein OmpA-like peptidoglycan-associated protein
VKEFIAAYYYLDEVSVQLLDTDKGEICECAAEEAGKTYSTMIYQKVFNITEEMSPKDKIEEQQVFFAFGRNKMNAQGEASLDFIAKTMKAHPEMKLQVKGHNNAMEDEAGLENDYYMDMDGKRISAVFAYLIDKGISESRLIASPKGSESPNPEVTDEDLENDEDLALAKSRRVSFKVR